MGSGRRLESTNCMVTDSPAGTPRPRRNWTVVAAVCVLCVAGLVELALASVALPPRGFTALKNQPAAVASPESTPAPVIPTPTQPLEPTPVREAVDNAAQTDAPFKVSQNAAPMQGGTSLGIVSAKLEGGKEGSKKLVVTIKGRPNTPIDVPRVNVQVYFYDEDEGKIVHSTAQVTYRWISPPVDWSGGEPELVEVSYLSDSVDPSVRFAGYVVAVYYKGDLQDYRAEPVRLTKLFPLKYFIGLDDQ